jgi:predicted regulator of Ras-like GTPase activity (Roadblock/LC7/MglB family)
MQEILQDITKIKGAEGVFFVQLDGKPVFQWTAPDAADSIAEAPWKTLLRTFPKMREIELLFTKRRVYMLRADKGFIIVVMDLLAPAAVMRLDCKIALSRLHRKSAVAEDA